MRRHRHAVTRRHPRDPLPTEFRPPLPRELFHLDPEVAFLNHGSFGATPRAVLAEAQRWQVEMERQPVAFLQRRFLELMEGARRPLAAALNADPRDVVLFPNATVALNLVARSLALRPGDEVLATEHEYGAMDRMWRRLCAVSGAVYRPAPAPLTDHAAFAEALWSAVTPRTRVLFISHVTSPTALILPVAELCRRARERGIITVVDGAHAPGQIPVDLAAIGADFYAANAHKWLCAPKGSAFLHARPARQRQLEPLAISWGDAGFAVTGSAFLDELQWTGTRDLSAWLAIPAALRFWEENDGETVRARCRELARESRRELSRLAGTAPLCPDSPEWFAQMFAVSLPPCDGARLQADLLARHRVEVPVTRWHDRPLLRVSVQGYNGPRDLARLAAALADCLPRARR